jgi:hypothetical protein
MYLHIGVMLPRPLASCPPDVDRCHDCCNGEKKPVLLVKANVISVVTYHSNAANTTAAVATLQVFKWLQNLISPSKVANATHPANQNIMVRASASKTPNLWAAYGNMMGEKMRYAQTRRVQTAQKRRKLASLGDHCPQAQL